MATRELLMRADYSHCNAILSKDPKDYTHNVAPSYGGDPPFIAELPGGREHA